MPYPNEAIEARKRQRVQLGEQARAILDKAQAEARDLNSDEQTEVDRMLDRADALGKEARRMERVSGLVDDLNTPEGRRSPAFDVDPADGDDDDGGDDDTPGGNTPEGRAQPTGPRETGEYLAAFQGYLGATSSVAAHNHLARAQQLDPQGVIRQDDDERGGVFVPPEQWTNELIKGIEIGRAHV